MHQRHLGDLPKLLPLSIMPLLSKSIGSAGKAAFGLLGRRSPALAGSCAGGNISSFSTTPSSASSVDASGFDTVACVGLGLMGHGICQVAATSGVHSKVVAFEQEQRFLDSGYVLCMSSAMPINEIAGVSLEIQRLFPPCQNLTSASLLIDFFIYLPLFSLQQGSNLEIRRKTRRKRKNDLGTCGRGTRENRIHHRRGCIEGRGFRGGGRSGKHRPKTRLVYDAG